MLAKISDVLDISVDYLLGRTEIKNPYLASRLSNFSEMPRQILLYDEDENEINFEIQGGKYYCRCCKIFLGKISEWEKF